MRRWRRWTAGSSSHRATPHLDTWSSSPYVHFYLNTVLTSLFSHNIWWHRRSVTWHFTCLSLFTGECGERDVLGGGDACLGRTEWTRWRLLCTGKRNTDDRFGSWCSKMSIMFPGAWYVVLRCLVLSTTQRYSVRCQRGGKKLLELFDINLIVRREPQMTYNTSVSQI